MKKIEELGISPWPWKSCIPTRKEVAVANLDRMRHLVVLALCRSESRVSDARLIAAAPELYECLRDAVIETCNLCESCSGHPEYKCENKESKCFVKKWHAVLEKAGGAK